MHRWAKTKQFPQDPDRLIGEYRVKQDSPEKMRAVAKAFVKLREETNAQPPSPQKPAKGTPAKSGKSGNTKKK